MNLCFNSSNVTTPRHGHSARPPGAAMAFSGWSAAQDWSNVFRHARLAPGLRPIVRRVCAGDAGALQAFIQGLSPASRRMRFHGAIRACSPALLKYLTQTDNPRHQAWLAFDGACQRRAIGEARFVLSGDGPDAEFAIAVADDWRGRGIADRLLQTVVRAATRSGIGMLFGDVLEDSARMFSFLRRHCFESAARADVDPGAVRWQRRLGDAVRPGRRLVPATGADIV